MALTTDQIKDIADDLDAIGDELSTRNWDQDMAAAVMTAAVSTLVGHAAMRTPVPQQYLPPPPYGYGADDFGPGPQTGGVVLQVQITGQTKDELEDRARQHGEAFFGPDADLVVVLNPVASQAQPARAGDPVIYVAGATVRVREPR